MAEVNLSFDEYISVLNHSNLPNTVIVEGKDDIKLYRILEKLGINIFPVGGRNTLLKIFEERHRLKCNNIAFIADKDVWVNIGIPPEYIDEKLIFTSGYSIENDVFIDFKCEDILSGKDNYDAYKSDLDKYIHWYTLAIYRLNEYDRNLEIAKHPNEIINNFEIFNENKYLENYPNELKAKIRQAYPLSIRGKSLIDLFLRNAKGHSIISIFDSIAARPGEKINSLFENVKSIVI
ncbi:hypothetical protein X808_18030 [Mannheimia varigena USDA-ARS-USMARC-1296]|uniref:DUF4435 domain-containing protein n=1 Tax=Mannheimia varigena USDA-ARS-USMARC-1296 TaxID=1433287 RepID=W0QGH1_9PAST|nr:DUF4435 domain-containing protein [Mannheimia varigena]AHG76323.1 hypothetical protein X808_18030 [Mannheimia varigena USDA-ARS-USMARC-1296]